MKLHVTLRGDGAAREDAHQPRPTYRRVDHAPLMTGPNRPTQTLK